MNYCLESNQAASSQLEDIVAEQVEESLSALQDYPHADPEGLHSARKCIKRLRSLLRLFQEEKYAIDRKTLNRTLRQVARSLSPHRDREVAVQHLEDLAEETDDEPLRTACLKAKSFLLRGNKHAGEEANFDQAQAGLRNLRDQVNRSSLLQITEAQLLTGAQKGKKRMVEAAAGFLQDSNKHKLHLWRKRTKDHYFQRLLLLNVLPEGDAGLEELKGLESQLGEARDCALLMEGIRDLQLQPGAAGLLLAHFEEMSYIYIQRAELHWRNYCLQMGWKQAKSPIN